jgi:hypothetical protein
MRRRRPIVPVLILVLLVIGGCFAPQRPDLDMGEPLVEKWRVPSPVPVAAGRTWTLAQGGLLGEGRRLAEVDPERGTVEWSLDLPAEYALTDASRTLSIDGALVLFNRDRSRVRVLGTESGETLWERAVPPGSQAFLGSESVAALVLAHCTAKGCTLTGVQSYDGRPVWTTHLGPGTLVDAPEQHAVFLVGPRRISQVSLEDGKAYWSIARPPGKGLRVLPSLYRVILFTPPAAPRCVATLRGVEKGKVMWTTTFPWHDAGAPPGTPCTYAPERLMIDRWQNVGVPVAGAIEQVDCYHGTSSRMALDPGEYVIDGTLSWTPGVGYRDLRDRGSSLDRGAAAMPPPSGTPWIRQLSFPALWLLRTGAGVALYATTWHRAEWQNPTVTAVQVASQYRLIFQDGTQLVGVGPKKDTPN